jgi:hypothetical protein
MASGSSKGPFSSFSRTPSFDQDSVRLRALQKFDKLSRSEFSSIPHEKGDPKAAQTFVRRQWQPPDRPYIFHDEFLSRISLLTDWIEPRRKFSSGLIYF